MAACPGSSPGTRRRRSPRPCIPCEQCRRARAIGTPCGYAGAMKRSIWCAIALLPCLLAVQSASGQDTNPLDAQLARIESLRTERPGDGLLVFLAAMTQSQLGRREQALADLRTLRG